MSERQANQIRGLSTTSPLHCVIVSTGRPIMSDHTGRRDASRVGGCYNESARFTRNFKVNNLDLVLLNYQHSRADFGTDHHIKIQWTDRQCLQIYTSRHVCARERDGV